MWLTFFNSLVLLRCHYALFKTLPLSFNIWGSSADCYLQFSERQVIRCVIIRLLHRWTNDFVWLGCIRSARSITILCTVWASPCFSLSATHSSSCRDSMLRVGCPCWHAEQTQFLRCFPTVCLSSITCCASDWFDGWFIKKILRHSTWQNSGARWYHRPIYGTVRGGSSGNSSLHSGKSPVSACR